jgi:hypothetical protein
LGRLLTEKFPEAKPEVLASVGCYPWISIAPDSFNTLINTQDTLLRDSMIAMYTLSSKKSDKPGTPPGGEDGGDPQKQPANNQKKEEEKKQQ